MRKKLSYDKKYLSDVLNYSQVPVRQIITLDLKPFQQIILIHLFSHATDWGISYNQISKSFFKTKNRNDIKKCFEALIEKGYLTESNDTYYIVLTKIQSDYVKFLTKTDSKPNTDSSANIDSNPNNPADSTANSGMIVPLSGGDSNPNSPIDSSTTNNNINKTDKKEKEKIIISSNNLNDDFHKIESLDSKNEILNKNHNTSIQVENDLDLILENSNHFNSIYYNANWNEFDIKEYSNQYLSHLIIEKEKGNIDKRIPSQKYFFISLLIEFSSILGEESKLWKEFIYQCNNENRIDLIQKYTSNYVKQSK